MTKKIPYVVNSSIFLVSLCVFNYENKILCIFLCVFNYENKKIMYFLLCVQL